MPRLRLPFAFGSETPVAPAAPVVPVRWTAVSAAGKTYQFASAALTPRFERVYPQDEAITFERDQSAID